MSTRPWARGHEEALTIRDRKDYLEGLGTIFKVVRASALVKAIFACRASIPSCPDLRPRPEVDPQPVFEPRNGSEVRQHLPVQRSFDGGPTDRRLPSDHPDRGIAQRLQRLLKTDHEDLPVAGTRWGILPQRARRPLAPRNVRARRSITSGSWHGPSVGQSLDSRFRGGRNYSRSGAYRSHTLRRLLLSTFRVIGGHIVTTPEGVFAHYKPQKSRVPKEVWKVVRPVAIKACRAADYASVPSALSCMSTVTYFLAWVHRQGLGLDLERVFIPAHVERYCATALKGLAPETQSTRRGYLRRVGRACTKKAPWPPDPKPFANNHVILPPHSAKEVEWLWQAARNQATEHQRHVALTMLTLGLGAGLKPGEMLKVSAEMIAHHPEDRRLVVILLEDRVVPVRSKYSRLLLALAEQRPDGPIIGDYKPEAKDPLGKLRANVRWPAEIAFRPSRLRTTWMADVLNEDVRISEFMKIAGTVSSKSLEVIAPYVEQRIEFDRYLFAAAGLKRGEVA